MKIRLSEKIKAILDKKDKLPVFTFRVYKRHIFLILFIIAAGLFGYAAYFKFFMVLPQSAAHIMPLFPDSLQNQKVLVIAPHCDDETLGAGGLIQQSLKGGSDVRVAIVTDCNYHGIGAARENESRSALSVLGLPGDEIDFLNFPEVESNKKPNPAGLSLKSALDKEINDYQPTIIVAPHPNDTHIDHKSAGIASRELAQEKYGSTKIAYYLIHFNFMRYPAPTGLNPSDYLLPPARLIGVNQRWYILNLSQSEEDEKQEAVLKYKTQLSLKNPILRRILLDFVRQNELFMIEQ